MKQTRRGFLKLIGKVAVLAGGVSVAGPGVLAAAPKKDEVEDWLKSVCGGIKKEIDKNCCDFPEFRLVVSDEADKALARRMEGGFLK